MSRRVVEQRGRGEARRFLRYAVYRCDEASDADEGRCERLAVYVDGAAALARAVWIARRGGYAQIDVYQAQQG